MDPVVGPSLPEGFRTPWPLAIVGEAPGAEEVRAGAPFVGPAGRLLFGALGRYGLAREDFWVGNVFRHRPPGNVIGRFFESHEPMGSWPSLDGKWPNPEWREDIDALVRDLGRIRPMLVVAVGRTALWCLTGKTRITPWAGRTLRTLPPFPDTTIVIAIRHPSWALRAGPERRREWEDRDVGIVASSVRYVVGLDGKRGP